MSSPHGDSRAGIGWLGWVGVSLSAYPLLIYLTFFAAWCCGRHAIGRWPAAGRDDPGDIRHAGLAFCKDLVWLEIKCLLPVVVVTATVIVGCLVQAGIRRDRWRSFGIVLVVATGSWGLFSADPLGCIAWYVD